MLLNHFLENSAQRLPNKVALIGGDKRLTYSEIDRRANGVAWFLRSHGIKRQDRVVIFLDNSIESVICLFGILKADAIFVILNPTMKAQKLGYILNNCQARALITHTSKLNVVSNIFGSVPDLQFVIFIGDKAKIPVSCCPNPIFWNEIENLPSHSVFNSPPLPARQAGATRNNVSSPPTFNIDLDLATLIYTSGSTGEPKGVMSAHHNMAAAVRSITRYLKNVEEDIILDALPLSFDYGLYQILMAFFFGGTVVLEKSFAFPYKIIEKLVHERVTGFPIVPTMAAMLLQMESLPQFDFTSLRYVTNTAASLPIAYIKKLQSLFPHVKIYSMYGLTECKRVSYLPPEQLDQRPGSVGIPIPNEEVFVVDGNGREVGPGEIGELVVRGLNVMQGYWNDPEGTARTFRPGKYRGDGMLYTGDLFKKDEEGYLYFVARKDDMIKTKGERVSPKEIENVLCELKGIAEAAVVGVPDEVFGSAIKAFIVCTDGEVLTGEQVKKYCMENLEPFMVPKYVEFIKALPKSSHGKVDKKALL
jgi:acyl-CoA synthetase (AMP-forming)/AMP-acid ligase II